MNVVTFLFLKCYIFRLCVPFLIGHKVEVVKKIDVLLAVQVNNVVFCLKNEKITRYLSEN